MRYLIAVLFLAACSTPPPPDLHAEAVSYGDPWAGASTSDTIPWEDDPLPGPWRPPPQVCVWPMPPWDLHLDGITFPLVRNEYYDINYCSKRKKFTFDGGRCCPMLITTSSAQYCVDSVTQRVCDG